MISYSTSRLELTYYTYQALPGTTYSAKGTGAYLLWKAHVDDGRIADTNDCGYMYIYPGSTRGALIKASDPAGYFTSSATVHHEMAFASWGPKSGTNYEVWNK